MEKFFAVVVELEDGKSKDLAATGAGPSEVFRAVKQAPGVRRVGKVREISPSEHAALSRGIPLSQGSGAAPGRREARSTQRGATSQELPDHARPGQAGQTFVGAPLSGPRVVLHTRSSGELPFRHLKAPPPRPAPPSRPAQVAPASPRRATKKRVSPPSGDGAQTPSASVDGVSEHRILKTRRQNSQPYQLQRGSWQTASGKRQFVVESEQGFDSREAAEAELKRLTM